jgi:hypothetical protein
MDAEKTTDNEAKNNLNEALKDEINSNVQGKAENDESSIFSESEEGEQIWKMADDDDEE